MRRSALALFAVLLTLMAPPATGTPGTAGPGALNAAPSSVTPTTVEAADRSDRRRKGRKNDGTRKNNGQDKGRNKGQDKGRDKGKGKGTKPRAWVPPDGAILSNPTLGNSRVILRRMLRTVRETKKGEFIRIATWNFADRRATDALLSAKKRGVRVQVITAGFTESSPFKRLRRVLDQNRKDKNWAMRCRGACRSKGYSMHAKFALFSKVNRKRHVSMVGSWNLTRAAGERQWNDLVTQSDRRLWKALRRTFAEMRRDRNAGGHPTIYRTDSHQLQVWPTFKKNSIATHLRKVRCWGDGRRTVVRVGIAGWFDEFGQQIAEVVRRKWDAGCDIRILTTLTGNGINRILEAPDGRGPVPIRTLALCCSDYEEGVPSKYLHMKAIAIDGAYGNRDRTQVLLTGSPNWSEAASRADELVLRIRDADRMVSRYIRRMNEWYDGGIAHRGTAWKPDPRLRFEPGLPDSFELD
jgi:phosphatidylserine/phosphatidylglycerophosphate/cardiolipin synthase-like enzyme